MRLFDMDSKEDYLLDGKYKVATPYAPLVNVVEVVRCKDCKWSIKDDWICGHPNNNAWNISVEHYCGYGERKDDD